MDFHVVIKPFFSFVKFLGLLPVTIRIHNSEFIATSTKFDKTYSTLVAFLPIVMIAMICYGVGRKFYYESSDFNLFVC